MQRASSSSFQGMSVAILAGGLGTRLRPVVSDRSKVVAEVRGRPFLAWLFDFLDQAGLKNLVLCTGFKGDVDLQEFYATHVARMALASLALAWAEDTRRFGRVALDDAERIVESSEKGSTVGPGWISAGVYLLQRELIEAIPPKIALSLDREIFPIWIPQGAFGFKTGGRFLDIGTPESYALANREPFQECLV